MWRSIGNRFRVLRRQLGLRQEDLAVLARVSRRVVQRIESGEWEGLTFARVQRVADALGARFFTGLDWHGEQLDRLVDAGHAEIQNQVVALLRAAGWLVAVEVSFNHFGDRGRYDILAYHPPTGIVLVVEIKTALGDVQATLGTLNVKVRLGLEVARQQGWSGAQSVVPALVLADERQQHRLITRHAALFAPFSTRSRTARAWVKRPHANTGGLLLYLPMTNARTVSLRTANRGQRVRTRGRRPTSAPVPVHMSAAMGDSPP